jgi:hypothetical protein
VRVSAHSRESGQFATSASVDAESGHGRRSGVAAVGHMCRTMPDQNLYKVRVAARPARSGVEPRSGSAAALIHSSAPTHLHSYNPSRYAVYS